MRRSGHQKGEKRKGLFKEKDPISGKYIFPKFYFRWRGMRNRCQNQNNPEYKRYGARGIFVCPEWENFEVFHAWCTATYIEGRSIDRINNDGPYAPENCRWATPAEQQANARVTEARREGLRYAGQFRRTHRSYRKRNDKGQFV